jgi:mono/diheme cytochrome c family protein
MDRQPKLKPLQESSFFADGRGSREPVAGTVPQGGLRLDDHLFRGRMGDAFVEAFPFAITRTELERGRERYEIFCAPCHDRAGTGRGIIVQRGYRAPASFHLDRLREAPSGYYFDVITRGFGAMPDYAAQIPPRDRWTIVAYVRALQLSQNATRADLTPQELRRLEEAAK